MNANATPTSKLEPSAKLDALARAAYPTTEWDDLVEKYLTELEGQRPRNSKVSPRVVRRTTK
jgi:hypothetical protein